MGQESLQNYLQYLVRYLKRRARGFNGYILGLSGGLDSAVVALLAQKAVKDDLLCVIIDIESEKCDMDDALELCKLHNLNYYYIDLTAEYRAVVKKLEESKKLTELSKINTKVRLRMVTLYALGQTHSKLVLGTDNKAELFTGYFTKHGDGAADLFVLSSLTKGEVFAAARLIGVTPNIINKIPSAGLYVGQTDEAEMGIKYEDLDAFISGKEVSPSVKARAIELHRISNHKRRPIPRPREKR